MLRVAVTAVEQVVLTVRFQPVVMGGGRRCPEEQGEDSGEARQVPKHKRPQNMTYCFFVILSTENPAAQPRSAPLPAFR